LESIHRSLNAKGFVTTFDDANFALELDLLNLEIIRAQGSGKFTHLPKQCHAGVDFLIGLGQTISVLSENAKVRLLGRLRKGLDEGLWPLQHELRVAASLSNYGWDIRFHDLEEGEGYDFLASRDGKEFEVEAKAISIFTGLPIKPENLDKLLVEIKQRFVWKDRKSIPVFGVRLSSNLSSNRDELARLVSDLNRVAQTRTNLSDSDVEIRFFGTIPLLTPVQLSLGTKMHADLTKRVVLATYSPPRIVLELDSSKSRQFGKKIIKIISETAREQFSSERPGVIWTHVNFISNEDFERLGRTERGLIGPLDRIATAALLSQKRRHLSQLVFSGGSVLSKTGDTARSSFKSAVYNSPSCRFGEDIIFPGGRKQRSESEK